ncbi:MAG: hypothetical protein ACUVX8_11460 [Candidatus Zipacnadales bacterium]
MRQCGDPIPVIAPLLLAGGLSLASVMGAGMAEPLRTGEPYALAGKRIVFTNWHYVHPGGFSWVNAAGETVTVSGSEDLWGAHFRRGEYPHGIRIVAQPARREGPLLNLEKPWEASGVNITTVIHVDGQYRGWGGSEIKRGAGFHCYFESPDGRHWTRPNLGLVEFEGSRENNLLDSAPGTVFIDPSAPPEERYKWVDLREISQAEFETFQQKRPDAWEPRAYRADVGHAYAVMGGVSPDGLHWTQLPEPLVVEHSDTQPVCYYDERLKKYVLYTRNWSVGERSPGAPEDRGLAWLTVGRRSIGRSESTNFRQFPLSEIILEPGPELLPSDTLYTNCKTTIPGAPDHHLLFPTVWHTSDDTTSIALASSRDGKLWHWLPGSPIATTAPFGEWDGGCIFAHPNLVELPNGDFALPYTGYLFPHKYPRGQWRYQPGLLVWPKGRLIALQAEDRGEFTTVPLIPPGRQLLINALTQRAGSILVEVVSRTSGEPLVGRSFSECDPIIGDRFHTPISWRGETDLGFQEGEAILLRFRMEQASIFALDFQ